MKQHPTADALRRVASGSGASEASRHVQGCAPCRADVDILRALDAQVGSDESSECPDALVLVSFHRGELAVAERVQLQRHAGSCPACAVALDVLAADTGAGTPPAAPSTIRRLSTAMDALLAGLAAFERPQALVLATRGGATASDVDEALAAAGEGRLEDAVVGLRRAIASGDADPVLRYHLGGCLVELGQLDEGLTHLEAAARSRRGFGEFAWRYAQALLLAGRGDAALKELKRCARLAGPRADAAREQAASVGEVLAKRSGGTAPK